MIKCITAPRLHMAFSILTVTALVGCTNIGLNQDEAAAEESSQSQASDALPSFGKNDQSPGFFRMKLGNYTVTALYDGYVEMDSKLFKGRPQATINRLLKQSKQPSPMKTPVNAFLLDDGRQVILVDAGGSASLSNSMGKLISSLKMSGYQPADVSAVLLTHLHPDHTGALAQDGAMVFPNAQLYVPLAEAAHWLAADRRSGDMPFYQGTHLAVAPYQQAGQFHTFTQNSSPLPSIQAISLPGHTPGHTAYRVRSGGESLLLWGDTVYSFALQLADPLISVDFDQDNKKSRFARTKMLQEAALSGEWIAGSHMPFPGIGQVLAAGKASYRWLPVDYSRALPNPQPEAAPAVLTAQ